MRHGVLTRPGLVYGLALLGGVVLSGPGATASADPPPPANRPPDAGATSRAPAPATPVPPVPSTSADGPIQTDAIRRIMRTKLGAVKRCYDQGLLPDPSPHFQG